MVLVLAAALFVVRSLDASRLARRLLAGLLLGAAGGMKPPNLLIGVGAALAYLRRAALARRRSSSALRSSRACSSSRSGRSAASASSRALARGGALAAGASVASRSTSTATSSSTSTTGALQMDQLREFFWSARLAQWAPFAGAARGHPRAPWRDRRAAGGWLAAFIVVKGFSTRADIRRTRSGACSCPRGPPTCSSSRRSRCSSRPSPGGSATGCARRRRSRRRRWVAVAAVLTVASRGRDRGLLAEHEPRRARVFQDDAGNFILTPVDDDVELRGRAHRAPGTDSAGRRRAVARRTSSTASTGPTRARDVECEHTDGARSVYCYIRSAPIATTRDTTYVDPTAPPGARRTASGSATNWLDDAEQGDVFAFSPAVPWLRQYVVARDDALLEQGDPLGELDVLVRQLGEHGRVVEQDEEDEERRDGEQDRRRIARDPEPAGDRVQAAAPGGEHEQHDSGREPEQRVALLQPASPDELEDDRG